MARSEADHLEQLRLTRDAIIDGLTTGQSVVRYMIRGREKQVVPSNELLETIEEQIEKYEDKVTRSSRGMLRVAQLRRPRRTND